MTRRAPPNAKEMQVERVHLNFGRLIICLFFIHFLWSSTPIFAQIPPNLSGLDNASVLGQKVSDEAEETLEKKREEQEIDVSIEQKKLIDFSSKVRFHVSDIKIEGNNWVSQNDIEPLTEKYRGKKLTLQELYGLTLDIEKEYRRQGFLTAYAYIPPQQIGNKEQAVPTIRVIEGTVGEQSIEGNRFFRKKRTLSYSTIRTGDFLKYGDLRETLRRMNGNPDRSVRAILKKGEAPKTTDIIYEVKDRFPLHMGATYDNAGARASGKNRAGVNFRVTNLTGHDDILSSGVVLGSEFGVVFSQYILPIPQTNSEFFFGFSHAQVAPKKESREFGVNGTSQSYIGKISQKLFEKKFAGMSFRVGMNFGLEFKENRTKVLSGTFRREKLRIIRFGPTVHEKDKMGTTWLYQDFAFGLNALGGMIFADPAAVRQGVQPNFFRYRGSVNRVQRMPWSTQLNIKFTYQATPGKLPSSEALYMGGASSVRGYPEGDYLADSGFLANVEYLAPFFFLPKDWKLPYSDIPIWQRFQLLSFIDQGYGQIRGPAGNQKLARYLAGVGGGVRIHLYRELYGRIEWGQPIGNSALTGSTRGRWHFGFETEF